MNARLDNEEYDKLRQMVEMSMARLQEIVAIQFDLPEKAGEDNIEARLWAQPMLELKHWIEKYRPVVNEIVCPKCGHVRFPKPGSLCPNCGHKYDPPPAWLVNAYPEQFADKGASAVTNQPYTVALYGEGEKPLIEQDGLYAKNAIAAALNTIGLYAPQDDVQFVYVAPSEVDAKLPVSQEKRDLVIIWEFYDMPEYKLISRADSYDDCVAQAISRATNDYETGKLTVKAFVLVVSTLTGEDTGRDLTDGAIALL